MSLDNSLHVSQETRSHRHVYFCSINNVVWSWSCHNVVQILRHMSIILLLSEGNRGIENHDNDIDLLQISKTMFAEHLFIHRIPSVLCHRPVT